MLSALLPALLPTLRVWIFGGVVFFTARAGLPEAAATGATNWLLDGLIGSLTFFYGLWAGKRELPKA